MNTHRLVTSALFASAFAIPLGFAAETSPGASNANQPYQRQAGEIAIHRVSADDLKADLTAKDFLGKSIYDPAGEKLGEILDLHLGVRLAGDTAREMNRNDRAGTSGTTSSDAADRNMPRRMEDNVAYVSVGGLLGVGDSVVTIPTAALQFDATKDRFTLNVRKADFVAIAKQEVPAYAAAKTEPNPSYAGPTRPDTMNASDDTTQVKMALQKDTTAGKLASRITVSESNGSIILTGTVTSQSDKDRIVTVARAATSKPVSDKITVASTP